jgi:hypothetical protein
LRARWLGACGHAHCLCVRKAEGVGGRAEGTDMRMPAAAPARLAAGNVRAVRTRMVSYHLRAHFGHLHC